jgi:hypothetical protein
VGRKLPTDNTIPGCGRRWGRQNVPSRPNLAENRPRGVQIGSKVCKNAQKTPFLGSKVVPGAKSDPQGAPRDLARPLPGSSPAPSRIPGPRAIFSDITSIEMAKNTKKRKNRQKTHFSGFPKKKGTRKMPPNSPRVVTFYEKNRLILCNPRVLEEFPKFRLFTPRTARGHWSATYIIKWSIGAPPGRPGKPIFSTFRHISNFCQPGLTRDSQLRGDPPKNPPLRFPNNFWKNVSARDAFPFLCVLFFTSHL